jgi:crossover junction endodeoxyribonuclease RuvC
VFLSPAISIHLPVLNARTAERLNARMSMRVLGIDPGLNRTGYGIVEEQEAGLRILEAGIVPSKRQDGLPTRILAIYTGVYEVLKEFAPDGMALEDLYTEYRFPRTALLMAHVRGAVCLAAAQAAVPVWSYAAREVKNAVVGYGSASKEQVQAMVQRLFALDHRPSPHDVADALALAVTGVYRQREEKER